MLARLFGSRVEEAPKSKFLWLDKPDALVHFMKQEEDGKNGELRIFDNDLDARNFGTREAMEWFRIFAACPGTTVKIITFRDIDAHAVKHDPFVKWAASRPDRVELLQVPAGSTVQPHAIDFMMRGDQSYMKVAGQPGFIEIPPQGVVLDKHNGLERIWKSWHTQAVRPETLPPLPAAHVGWAPPEQ